MKIIRDFARDERGIALILVAILLPVLIGFALLVIDYSRAGSLHNDLQKGADAMSLASAAELDGRSDSITRADNALATLVDNTYRFSDAGPQQTLTNAGVTRRYLRSLPTNDSDPIAPGDVIIDEVGEAVDARFIEVTVTPIGFAAIFPASFVGGGANGFDIGAVSVAGFNRAICESLPMFMCNPFEGDTPGTGKTFQQAFADGDTYSREFRILKVDSNPGPGNFGLLQTDIPLREAFAKGTSGVCYDRTAVETKTGVTLGHVNTGLNVRFDLYSGSLSKENKNKDYRPATNVRKGASKTSNCGKFTSASDTPLSAMGFPLGNNYDSTKGMTDSTWNRAGYWSLNHLGAAYPAIPSSSHPTSTSQPASRYDVYRYEIDPAHYSVGDKSPAPSKESGEPACYKGPSADLTSDPDRRLLTMAVVDCKADKDKINGHTQLRPDAYVSMFLTNPVEKQDNSKNDEDETANEKPIRLEVVDVEGPQGNGSLDKLLRDEPQLYR